MGDGKQQVFFPEFKGMNTGRKAIATSEASFCKNWLNINGMADVHGPRYNSVPAIGTAYSYPVRRIWKWVSNNGVPTQVVYDTDGTTAELTDVTYGTPFMTTTGGYIGTNTTGAISYTTADKYYEGGFAATPYTSAQYAGVDELLPYSDYIEFEALTFSVQSANGAGTGNSFYNQDWSVLLGINIGGLSYTIGVLDHTALTSDATATLTSLKIKLTEPLIYHRTVDTVAVNYWIQFAAPIALRGYLLFDGSASRVRFTRE